MDLAYTEQQKIIMTAARDFLTSQCPKPLVREMEEDNRGYSPELWRQMAAMGWLGIIFPEEYGGGGGSFLDLVVLLEEMGRALLPSPFIPTVVLSGLSILEAGSEKQKQEFLPRIASGELILSVALTEPDAEYCGAAISTSAGADRAGGGGYVINGVKLFVDYAQVADFMLCVARSGTARESEAGISLFLIDTRTPGTSYTLLPTLAGDKQYEVVFSGVSIPGRNLLGKLGGGWATAEKILRWGALAKCAEMVGAAQQVLEMTTGYAKERVQFGRPIGSFQAIQHYCADMAIEVETSRLLTYQAAQMIAENNISSDKVSIAKSWVDQSCKRVMAKGHQIHGGIGFSMDHDMQLYYRRAKAAELAFGDATFHRELVAQGLGL